MIWERVPKERTIQPKKGSYQDWKESIANEGKNKCVYCAIHEDHFGGIRNYHVEHFRPKSKKEFAQLINDMTNLYYACSICNCFKGDDWPSEPIPDFSNCSYADPSKVEYSTIFTINEASGEIEANNTSAAYMLNKLHLNRPQLILERRTYFLHQKLDDILESVSLKKEELFKRAYSGSINALGLIESADKISKELLKILNDVSIRPYKTSEIKR